MSTNSEIIYTTCCQCDREIPLLGGAPAETFKRFICPEHRCLNLYVYDVADKWIATVRCSIMYSTEVERDMLIKNYYSGEWSYYRMGYSEGMARQAPKEPKL